MKRSLSYVLSAISINMDVLSLHARIHLVRTLPHGWCETVTQWIGHSIPKEPTLTPNPMRKGGKQVSGKAPLSNHGNGGN